MGRAGRPLSPRCLLSRKRTLTLIRGLNMIWLVVLCICFPTEAAPPVPESETTHVICSVEEYIQTGMEFEMCQEHLLANYSEGKDPCPILKQVVEICAGNVKPCFTEAGYKRGQQIFFDQLALQYPEIHMCEVFKPDDDLTSKKPHELCSIAEEVVNGQEIARCSNQQQGEMARDFMTHVPASEEDDYGSPEEQKQKRRDHFCGYLLKIKEDCIDSKLRDCYTGHDFDAHAGYLTEGLKISVSAIALHLAQVGDIAACPVFDPYRIHPDELDSITSSNKGDTVNLTLAVLLALIVTLVVTGVLGFLAAKFRVFPRVKAWVSNVPYEDMIVTEQTAGQNMSQGTPSNGIEEVMQNHMRASRETRESSSER